MTKSRIRTSRLEIGMVVASDILSIKGVKIVSEGTILNEQLIEKIKKYGVTAVNVRSEEISSEDGKVLGTKITFGSVQEVKESVQFHAFKENFTNSLNSIKKSLLKIVNSNDDIDIDSLIAEVDGIIANNCGIELFEMINCMKEKADSLFTHSLNVAIMSSVLAKWARFAQKDIDMVVASAILHDVGKLKIPSDILNSNKLSTEERRYMRKHSIYGYNILKDKVDRRISQVALSHHERYDGSGYPMAKKGLEIPDFARLIAIVDVFDELTSRKENDSPVCPFDIIRMFEIDGLQKFDTEYLLVFLSCIADTYIGYDVQLNNGKKGTIVFSNKSMPSRPMIKSGGRYIDLGMDTSLSIVKLL